MKTDTLIDWREWKDGDAAFARLNELLAPHGVELRDVTPPHSDCYELEAESRAQSKCEDCLVVIDDGGIGFGDIRESEVVETAQMIEQDREARLEKGYHVSISKQGKTGAELFLAHFGLGLPELGASCVFNFCPVCGHPIDIEKLFES